MESFSKNLADMAGRLFKMVAWRHIITSMSDQGSDDQYSDEETERRAREAIRRSFEIPHKPQKEMVGRVGRPKRRSRPVDKGQDQV
jgi:hypothetical protein